MNMDLQTYKVYQNPFDTSSVKQWLKFQMKLDLIITRNGLMASLAKLNLMQSLLKGEALQHFNNKAQELKTFAWVPSMINACEYSPKQKDEVLLSGLA